MKALRHILRSKYLFKIIFLISIIYIVCFFKFSKRVSIYNEYNNSFIGVVEDYKYDTKLTLTIKSNKEKLIVYYPNKMDINFGDTILVEGQEITNNNSKIFNTFNYQKYLEKKKVYHSIYASNIKIIKRNTNVIVELKTKLYKRIEKITKSSNYILAFILGNRTMIDKDIMNVYQENGIIHIFSISGMHISLFSRLLYKLIKKVSYNNYFNFCFVLVFLLFYLILLSYPVSLVRAVISFSLFKINRLFNFKVKYYDIMLLLFSIMVFINPNNIFEISFIFSYTISFFLKIFNAKKKKTRYKRLYTSFIVFIVSLPLVIYYYYSFNLFSIILNIIYIPFISFIILPLSILTLIFPILDNILYILIKILELTNLFLNKITLLKVVVAKPSIYLIIIYYLIVFLYLKNKKYLTLLFFYVVFLKYNYLLDNSINILYFDVGQGDSVMLNYKNEVVLIDTGENKSNEILSYLKSIGRTKIDYLILTHGDRDHMEGAINLVNKIIVKKIVFNCGDYNELEQELIEELNKKKIPHYTCVKEIKLNNNKLYFLKTRDYHNENDNSIVIYTKISNYKFLFMGDASITVEENLIKKYNIQDIDVLKVGHHGSKTSSGKYFIDIVNPKYSIISVGKNNRYNHPSSSVLENLFNSKVYRTDNNGSIMFKIKNNTLEIDTYM